MYKKLSVHLSHTYRYIIVPICREYAVCGTDLLCASEAIFTYRF